LTTDRTVKLTLLFSPTPACRWSSVHTFMWNWCNWVPHGTATFWVVHGAVHATSPQKFARHVQRPRSACELACSDQWPASRVQKNKKKINIPIWAENL
jgi:hypothetical protein